MVVADVVVDGGDGCMAAYAAKATTTMTMITAAPYVDLFKISPQ